MIYVDGPIIPGYAGPSPFGPEGYARSGNIRYALEKAAGNTHVKAVVMRINSPGGSAEASEVILNAAKRLQAVKPLIVSMGDIAGSGGYYVALGADAIVADEMTITASIGVVVGKLITTGMWDKLGINWYSYQWGANADLFSSAHRFTDPQRQKVNDLMRTVYETFKAHVQEARGGKLTRPLAEVVGGRVFTGRQALELGLIDKIGGLNDAAALAAERAGVGSYEMRVIPEPKDFFTQAIEKMSGRGKRPSDVAVPPNSTIDLAATPFKPWLTMLERVDPQRTAAVCRAVQLLNLVHRHGVALIMPVEFIVR